MQLKFLTNLGMLAFRKHSIVSKAPHPQKASWTWILCPIYHSLESLWLYTTLSPLWHTPEVWFSKYPHGCHQQTLQQLMPCLANYGHNAWEHSIWNRLTTGRQHVTNFIYICYALFVMSYLLCKQPSKLMKMSYPHWNHYIDSSQMTKDDSLAKEWNQPEPPSTSTASYTVLIAHSSSNCYQTIKQQSKSSMIILIGLD